MLKRFRFLTTNSTCFIYVYANMGKVFSTWLSVEVAYPHKVLNFIRTVQFLDPVTFDFRVNFPFQKFVTKLGRK